MSTETPGVSVIFGNSAPIHHYPEGPRRADHLTRSTTVATLHPKHSDPEWVKLTLSTDNDLVLRDIAAVLSEEHQSHAIAVREITQFWSVHSAISAPAWVASEDTGLAAAVAAYFGCPVWTINDEGIAGPTALLVTVGRDAIHNQVAGTGTQPAACHWIGLTASVTAPATSDTTLTGEITTGGGGLIRATCTFAHTTGTNTSTLTNTFTANGSDTLPVTIAQIGVFNAITSGTLFFHTALSGTATLSVSGDNLTVTETITAG